MALEVPTTSMLVLPGAQLLLFATPLDVVSKKTIFRKTIETMPFQLVDAISSFRKNILCSEACGTDLIKQREAKMIPQKN